ncbi:MAG: ImmA/IrrE family metallo-endopeptidase [Pseudoxanthomonas sp.]
MERLEAFNPARLRWCMEDAHISTSQLARDVGIAEGTLSRAIDGNLGLTFIQIQKLGKYFGRTPLFFLETGAAEPQQIRSPQFRTLLNQQQNLDQKIKRIIQLAEWQREAYISLLQELDQLDFIEFNPPELRGADPIAAARVAREWLGIESEHTFEQYRNAIESRGALIFRTNGYAGKWQIPSTHPTIGFSLYHTQYPIIVVRKENAESRQTFTLAHELGHLLLFRESTIDSVESLSSHARKERLANEFAGHFLIPQDRLNQINHGALPTDPDELEAELQVYRRLWGVSTDVILLRLIASNRLPQIVYDNFVRWRERRPEETATGGSREWRHREPRHILGDNYVRTVLQALDTNRLTLVKASKYLDDLKLTDIRQLEQYYAGH